MTSVTVACFLAVVVGFLTLSPPQLHLPGSFGFEAEAEARRMAEVQSKVEGGYCLR